MSVDLLYNLGDDALQNLFECIIPSFPGAEDVPGTQFRIQNFTIPASGVGEYEIHYKTQMITKPSGKIEQTKEFSFDFRVDRLWRVYAGLKSWKNTIANTRLGFMAPDELFSFRRPITVITTDPNGTPTSGKWVFEGSWIKTLGDVGFDYTSGEPIMVTATFGFQVMNDLLF